MSLCRGVDNANYSTALWQSAVSMYGDYKKKGGMGMVTPTEKTSFVIQVQYQQNATWQGVINWVDAKKTQRFRSVLEMIKLMDDALSQGAQELPAWAEDKEAI
jgi:hypothetical protein